MPQIDINMVVHNCEPYLRQALESVLAQTWQDWRCIIIDDVSTDDSAAIAREYVDRDKRFVLHQIDPAVRRPFPYARNVGLSQSTAKWIAILDGDDWWEPWKLERQIAALKQAGPGKILCATGLTEWENGTAMDRRPDATTEQVDELMPIGNVIAHSTVLMDRESVMKLDGYDESMHTAQDWDLWLRMLRAYGPDICIMLDDRAVHYRRHGSNITSKVLRCNRYEWRITRRSLKYYLFKRHDLRRTRFVLDFRINSSVATYHRANHPRGAAAWALLAVASAPWKTERWVQAWQSCKTWLCARPTPVADSPAKPSEPS